MLVQRMVLGAKGVVEAKGRGVVCLDCIVDTLNPILALFTHLDNKLQDMFDRDFTS